MKYITTVGEKEYTIEIDHDDEIVVNGERFAVDFQDSPDGHIYSLLLNNQSLEGLAMEREEGWQVLIRGELYNVQVQDERSYRLAQARGTAASVTGEATVKSPMPGIIIATPVAADDMVKKGETVIILESMKMENELRAPRDGKVARVFVEPGTGVEKNQPLLVIIDPAIDNG